MIVSGGKILAIDGVEHDFTLSGDGVKTPIGITEELLEKIRDVSGKLDTTDFETWSGQTEHWDVQEYSGGEGIKVENHLISVSAKYLTSGDLEPYATQQWVKDQKYITSAFLEPYAQTEWVQEELAKKQDASAMSAYAQSAWVNENFQPKGDYVTSAGLEAALEPYATQEWVGEELAKKVDVSAMSAYATSAWVDENFLKQADYHEYSAGNDYIRIDEYKVYGYDWTSAVSAVPFKLDTSSFNDYSAWADDTYLKQDALEPYATSDWVNEELSKKQDASAMSAYATSAQGTKADSAIQGVNANGTRLIPDRSRVVNITSESIGLGNVDNTSDEEKKSSFTGVVEPMNTGFATGGAVYDAIEESESKIASTFLSSTGKESVVTNDTTFHTLLVDSIKLYYSGDFFKLDDGILSLRKGAYSFSVRFSIDMESLEDYEPSNKIQLVTFYVSGEVFNVNVDRSIVLTAEGVCFSGMVLITEDNTDFEIKVKTSSEDLLSVNLDSISLVKMNHINIVKKRAYLMTSDNKFIITNDGKKIISEYSV